MSSPPSDLDQLPLPIASCSYCPNGTPFVPQRRWQVHVKYVHWVGSPTDNFEPQVCLYAGLMCANCGRIVSHELSPPGMIS